MSKPSSFDRNRTIFLAISAGLALAVVLATRAVILPFVLASVIAYVLTPAVSLVERARVPRWVAVLIVYAVTFSAIYTFAATITPRLVREVKGLKHELPALSVHIRDRWVPAFRDKLREAGIGRSDDEPAPASSNAPLQESPASVLTVHPSPDGSYSVQVETEVELTATGDRSWRIAPVSDDHGSKSFDIARYSADAIERAFAWGRRNTFEVLRYGSTIVALLSRGIFLSILTLMLAAYIMISRERIIDFFRVLVKPSSRASFNVLLARLDRGLAGVVRGQLLICCVNGVLSAIGFSLVGLKYWPILSIVAAVMSIIPIFGSILSSIPAVAIGLTQGIGTALFVLLWVIGIHQLEANILNPKIYGIAAKIHPVLVIFSLLVGEHFFSLTGALLAVPCMSIVQNVFLHFRALALGPDAPRDSFSPPPPE